MKRRIFSLFLMILLVLMFSACEQPDHDKLISEIGEKNGQYQEKRRSFLDSEVTGTANTYVKAVLAEFFPENELQMSLEPGSLLDEDLSHYSDFSENEETRKQFFSKADLYIKVNFWNYDTDGKTAAEMLISRQIGGRLAADEYGKDVYLLDAVGGTVIFEPMPGV